jgi:hypothetical protein
MGFFVITGSFHPEFGEPDGDSVRFVADNPDTFFKLRRQDLGPKLNPTNGSIQTRYEGIDALEKQVANPLAAAARRFNLDACGTDGGAHPAPGYLLSNQLDPHGRPICFVFTGDAPEPDGSENVFLDVARMQASVNYKVIEAGLAYPLFYNTLYSDLRQALNAAAAAAKAGSRGVWREDVTNTGADWPTTATPLRDFDVVFPKLWRRIEDYFADDTYFTPDQPFAGLKPWIEAQEPERVFLLSEQKSTGFDNVVETTATTVRLTNRPDDIIFF